MKVKLFSSFFSLFCLCASLCYLMSAGLYKYCCKVKMSAVAFFFFFIIQLLQHEPNDYSEKRREGNGGGVGGMRQASPNFDLHQNLAGTARKTTKRALLIGFRNGKCTQNAICLSFFFFFLLLFSTLTVTHTKAVAKDGRESVVALALPVLLCTYRFPLPHPRILCA